MRGKQRTLAGAVFALFAVHATATTATWVPTATGTTYDWTNGNNWSAAPYPDGAGETAGITNDIVGGQTIRLRRNITVGTLNIGDAVASAGNYSFTLGNLSPETFILTFDSGAQGSAATLRIGSSGTPSNILSLPMSLSSDLRVDLNGLDAANAPKLSLSGTMAMNGHTLVFTNGVAGANYGVFTATSEFSGSGMIVQNSRCSLNVTGNKTFTGTLVANSGRGSDGNQRSFSFIAGTFTNAAEFIINGYLTGTVNQFGGIIHTGSGSSFTTNPGQRLTVNRITLNGGTLEAGGNQATVGTANDWQKGLERIVDNVGALNFNSGYSVYSFGVSANTAGRTINVSSLERKAGASAYQSNYAAGSNANLYVSNSSAFLLGAGGGAGSKTNSIVPWILVSSSGSTGDIGGFAGYDSTLGLRYLTTAEYDTSITAGATYDVKTGTPALATDAAVNALWYTAAGTNSIGTNRTLTVASGGLLFTGGRGGLGASGSAGAGTVNFGTAEGVVWAVANNTNMIGAQITGSGGLTKAGTGVMVLSAVNTYSGTNHVGGGTLRVGDGTNASRLGTGDVHVHAGATLWISSDTAIDDAAILSLYKYGFYNGRVQLDAGRTETVKELYWADVGQPAGTYGSTSSSAQFKDDAYFAGAGVLNVTQSAGATPTTTAIIVR